MKKPHLVHPKKKPALVKRHHDSWLGILVAIVILVFIVAIVAWGFHA
jgi:hypothetical protein